VEIPVELTYKIIDSKFGLNLIGGFSTLLLNENVVSVSSPTYTIVLGEANNLNKIHYSSNIGLGFKYSIFKSVNLTFDPVFKYQLNTFSTNSGNFKPYFLVVIRDSVIDFNSIDFDSSIQNKLVYYLCQKSNVVILQTFHKRN